MSDILIICSTIVVLAFLFICFMFANAFWCEPYREKIIKRCNIMRPNGEECYRQDITISRTYKNGRKKIYIKHIHY